MAEDGWPGDRDELDDYLAEKRDDAAFSRAYERAEWIDRRWWRRLLNRWGLLK